ncbi:MAG: hypothetical protein U1E29_02155 [Coriobacteriia bacterium]|nr:hypothetical protein [Coriobacteriia bacterium]
MSSSRECLSQTRVGVYILPNVQRSSDDALRLEHRDLPDLSDRQLFAEAVRVREALAAGITEGCRATLETCEAPYFVPAVIWLEQRAEAVRSELARRKGGRR